MSTAFGFAPGWSPQALLGAIDDALRTGVCITDRNGRFVAVSRGYCEIYGYPANALLGRRFTMVVPREQRAEAQRLHDLFIETGEEIPLEWQVLGAHGRRLWVRVGAARFFDTKGNPFKMTTVEDVTAQREAEEALTAANQELEQLNRAKDRLFSIIGHDLRSPFTPILGYAEVMSRSAAELDATQVLQYADRIREAAASAMALLDSLLAWARLQMEDALIRPTDCRLEALVHRVLHELDAVLRRKELSVTVDLGDLTVRADPFMASTAIRNILSNAAKFTPHAGTISIEAAHPDTLTEVAAAALAAGQTVLAVRDSGIGMDADLLDRLFVADAAIVRAGTDAEPSSGFGLQVAHEMIGRNGGTISAASVPGEGSTFFLSFPSGAAGSDGSP